MSMHNAALYRIAFGTDVIAEVEQYGLKGFGFSFGLGVQQPGNTGISL